MGGGGGGRLNVLSQGRELQGTKRMRTCVHLKYDKRNYYLTINYPH